MKRISRIYRLPILVSLAFVVTLASFTSVSATVIFSWSGAVVGEREDFSASGWASFEVSGLQMIITLTNTTSQTILATGEVLTGLVFDINNDSVILTPVSAMMQDSVLIGYDSDKYDPQPTNLSGEWGFKDDANAGLGHHGPLGSYAIGAMGDINFGADSFGPKHRFDTDDALNFFGPKSGALDGIDGGIAGPNIDLDSDGFWNNGGPLVQGNPGGGGKMIFTFGVSGNLQESDIENVQPLFGTDGAPLTPEPGTLLLVGSGLAGLAGYARLRLGRKRK